MRQRLPFELTLLFVSSVALASSCGSDESDDSASKGGRGGTSATGGDASGSGGGSGTSTQGGAAGSAGRGGSGDAGMDGGGQAGVPQGGGGGGGNAGTAGQGGAGGEGGSETPGITVRVYLDDGTPRAGITALLHAASGEVLDEQTTDARGEVRFETTTTTLITILEDTQAGLELRTLVGTEPGDVIVLGQPTPVAEPTVDVRVAYPGPYTGADSYLMDLGCTGGAFGVVNATDVMTRAVSRSCLGGDSDFSGIAAARQGTTPIAFSGVRDVPMVNGAPTPLPVGAWTAPESLALDFTNLTSEITDTQLDVRVALDGRVHPFFVGNQSPVSVPARSLVDGYYVRASLRALAGSETRQWAWRRVLPATTPSPHSLDFAGFGPRFDTLDVDAADAARPTLSWTSSSSTQALGAVVVRAIWSDLSTAPETSHNWTVVVPPGTTSVALPALPASAANYRPSATADYTTLQVFGFWYEDQPDYAAFRNSEPFALGNAFVRSAMAEARMLVYQRGL